MPDNQDYADLGRLLRSPSSWSPADAAVVRSLLANQMAAVAAAHPEDRRRLASLQALVDQIESALDQYESR